MLALRDFLNNITLNLPCFPFMVAKKTELNLINELIKKISPVDSGRKMIRLGPDKDGGYIIPDDLEGITACFSPGVADEAGGRIPRHDPRSARACGWQSDLHPPAVSSAGSGRVRLSPAWDRPTPAPGRETEPRASGRG